MCYMRRLRLWLQTHRPSRECLLAQYHGCQVRSDRQTIVGIDRMIKWYYGKQFCSLLDRKYAQLGIVFSSWPRPRFSHCCWMDFFQARKVFNFTILHHPRFSIEYGRKSYLTPAINTLLFNSSPSKHVSDTQKLHSNCSPTNDTEKYI